MAKLLRFYRDFRGGLSEIANDNMRDNQLSEAANVVAGASYGIARASGYDIAYPVVGAGNEDVLAVLAFKPVDTEEQTICFTTSRLYRLDGEAWTEVLGGLQPIRDWFIYGGKVYWLDGRAYRVYNGTSAAAVTQTPASGGSLTEPERQYWSFIQTAEFVEQRGTRWFFAKRGSNDIYYTEVGDPAKIRLNNILYATSKDSDTITGLKEFEDGILIFKERSVHFFSGWDFANGSDISMRQLSVTSGTKFHQTIQTVDNAVLYLGYNGVYRLRVPAMSTVIASENVSEGKLDKTLYSLDPENAYAVVWNGVYYFRVARGAISREYRYDVSDKSFWGEFTQAHTCYSVNMGEANLFLGCQNGLILRADSEAYHYIATQDIFDETGRRLYGIGERIPIPVRAVTKGFDISDAMIRDVKLKRVLVVAKQYKEEGSNIVLAIKADYADLAFHIDFDESLVWGEGEYGATYWGWQDSVTKEATVNKKAKRVQFLFRSEETDEPLLIYGVGMIFKLKKAKGSRAGVRPAAVQYDD